MTKKLALIGGALTAAIVATLWRPWSTPEGAAAPASDPAPELSDAATEIAAPVRNRNSRDRRR